MTTNTAILDTGPTSYWPLTDNSGGATCHDEMALHDAVLDGGGVNLAVIPFGDASAPFFDGESGSVLTESAVFSILRQRTLGGRLDMPTRAQ